MIIKIKKLHPNAVIPTYARPGDAGLDITALDSYREDQNIVYTTGLSIEIPKGFVGLIFPRSSISKKDIYLTNHVGVIDSGYRGEVLLKFRIVSRPQYEVKKDYIIRDYCKYDRVAQLVIIPYPAIEFEEVEELSQTERAEQGHGSTGN